ncbi:MAG: GTPase HflX [Actinomycetota bacterium]|nr:GTPase HflX [Actinomycetota bacterium]
MSTASEKRENASDLEKAFLVGVHWGYKGQEEAERSLCELRSLAETAGAIVLGSVLQTRSKPDPATLMGKGKLRELAHVMDEKQPDLMIFDQELTPSQQRNLTNELQVPVLDRTALILDIFAQHAHSKEGKAQVEMAQLRYTLTRLSGRGSDLSRLGGGIGTRGPGETKLEVDRRMINARLKTLDKELKNLTRVRRTKRKRRDRLSVPNFALVGYTNAGKSSLLNALTDAHVLVENQLFSTLDPITRRVELPGNRRAVITDTVGFINHLPHQLVEAFKSTLEEVVYADVLLHVVDASSSDIKGKMNAVEEVLDEIGAGEINTFYILNKIDLLTDEDRRAIVRDMPDCTLTSTLSGVGLAELKSKMSAGLASRQTLYIFLPHGRGDLLSLLYQRGQVLSRHTHDDGFLLAVEIPENLRDRLEEYVVDQSRISLEAGTGEPYSE